MKVLVVYKCLDYPLRKTISEHLYSFKKYSDAKCYYLMLDRGRELGNSEKPIPAYIRKTRFDIIIFHYGFLASRSNEVFFNRALQQIKPLLLQQAIKIILPQDECIYSDNLVRFVNEFSVDFVFSVAPETEWKKIYHGVDFNKVKFRKVLTGYLDEDSILEIADLSRNIPKTIDIGYRARNLPQWLGRHGYKKTEIASVVTQASGKFRLHNDISVDPKDTFYGQDWYRFLVSCKYMIGVEGGATVLDTDGTIAAKGQEYLYHHPDCTFEEIEQACFPDKDGQLQLIAISPRHLEACASRTCQILVESTFNGILQPWIHYIPMKADYSNLDEVLRLVQEDKLREALTTRAYEDIVTSNKYSYKEFVSFVMEQARPIRLQPMTITDKLYHRLNGLFDRIAWRKYYFWLKIFPRITNKYTYLIPLIHLVKALGLKQIFIRLKDWEKQHKNFKKVN